ncbi:UPF0149 family protein [Halothiobacillus sp. DCM-1]|uniref:UPF0149 family protein n=1 Tax=Halothiobacillus sp. DCM-1 TaxID=3112558 RepID=UPI0032445A24
MNDARPALDYPRCHDALAELGSSLNPSEAQGVLIGLWLGAGHATVPEWLDELTESDGSTPPLSTPPLADALRTVFDTLIHELTGADQLGLSFLLPADDEPLPVRLQGLIDLAQSLLYGYARAGGSPPEQLAPEAREVFDDLVSLCNIDALAEPESTEEDEQYLQDITDYLSAALIVLFINRHPPVPQPPTRAH